MSAVSRESVSSFAPSPGLRGALSGFWADKARVRRVLMIWGVALIAAVTAFFYLTGGRYVGSDDSYIHARKLMVSTDVSLLATDKHRGYRGIEGFEDVHGAVYHSASQYVTGAIHTNTIEGFWSLIKRGVMGSYPRRQLREAGRPVSPPTIPTTTATGGQPTTASQGDSWA